MHFLYGTNLPGKMAAGWRLTGGTKIQYMCFSPKKWPLEGVLLCYSFTWWMHLLSKCPYLEGTRLFRQFVCLKKVPFKEFPWKLTSYWSSAANILFIPNFQQVSPYFTPSTVHFWIQWPLGLLIPLPFEDGLSQITLVLSFSNVSSGIGSFVLAKSGVSGPPDFQIQNLVAMSAFSFSLSLRVCLLKNSFNFFFSSVKF